MVQWAAMLDTPPYILIALAAFSGLILTIYIHHKKRYHEPMVCPLGTDCTTVVTSEFSHFLGVPVEWWGMLYYATIFATYVSVLVIPTAIEWGLLVMVVPLSLGAFLFSVYLTFIQAVTLRQWCTWCLISAGLCTLIFAFTLSGIATFMTGLVSALVTYKTFIVGLHVLGVAIGLGGASLADLFFFKFLKDLRISEREAEVLRGISQFIWLGLAILIISGTGLFLTNPALYASSPKFLVKMIVVAVIIINGAFLNLFITPKLIRISFGDQHRHAKGELRTDRRLAYAQGAISASSWYSAFILGLLPQSPLDFLPLLGLYVAVVLAAVLGSQIIEHFIARRGWKEVELRHE